MSPRRTTGGAKAKAESSRDALAAELARLRAELRERDARLEGLIGELRRVIGGEAGETIEAAQREDDERRAYERLCRDVRTFIRRLPRGAAVAVASRGDDALVKGRGRRIDHFPSGPGGGWAGYYPPDGTAVIAHLESLRADGIEYLVLPETARWWLEAYPGLAAHLAEHYEPINDAEGVAAAFHLARRVSSPTVTVRLAELVAQARRESPSAIAILDWDSGLPLADAQPAEAVFSPPSGARRLPYIDGSVDFVVIGNPTEDRIEEGRRVAGTGLIVAGPNGEIRDVELLRTGTARLPSASIIIPTWNGIAHLDPCLRALGETLPPDFVGEVIVVDDASATATADVLDKREQELPWLRVVRNPRNYGFISSCNRGAKAASAEYLVFLNDDTIPQSDWLGALLGTFRAFPDAGAVGGKLIYPDGRLQEAGGIIYRDGSGANFGRGDYDVDAPLYRYVRPVSYCSGALLATPAALFNDIGGFDRRYRPAYYEDTDYCFSIRESGYRVYYQPDCVVVHLEGATSGTDIERGIKRHQVVNRKRFQRKWRHRLDRLPEPPSHYTKQTWHELAALREVA